MVYHLTVAGKWRKIIGIYNSEWRRYRARLQAARVAAQVLTSFAACAAGILFDFSTISTWTDRHRPDELAEPITSRSRPFLGKTSRFGIVRRAA
jgi:hypothetical protein